MAAVMVGRSVVTVVENTCQMSDAGLGVTALADGFEGRALAGVGPLVHDHLKRAVAQMDRARPHREHAPREAVERHAAVAAALDADEAVRAAVAVRRQGIELARAPAVTAAVGELRAFNLPLGERHLTPVVRGTKPVVSPGSTATAQGSAPGLRPGPRGGGGGHLPLVRPSHPVDAAGAPPLRGTRRRTASWPWGSRVDAAVARATGRRRR